MNDSDMPQGYMETVKQENDCEHEWEYATWYKQTPDPFWSLMPIADGKRCKHCKEFRADKWYNEATQS